MSKHVKRCLRVEYRYTAPQLLSLLCRELGIDWRDRPELRLQGDSVSVLADLRSELARPA